MFAKWNFWKRILKALIWQIPFVYGLTVLLIRFDAGVWNWQLRTWGSNYSNYALFTLLIFVFLEISTTRERELRKEMDEIREKLRKEVR